MSDNFLHKLNKALVMLESYDSKSLILSQLETICKQLQIPATVIGGMAVMAHGYARHTANIDLLVAKDDAAHLANGLLAIGWEDIGQNKLLDRRSNVIINLCAEGVKAGKVTFPAPQHTDPTIKVADLPLLLRLKLLANRYRDRSDFVELIKANQLSKEYIIELTKDLTSIDQKQAIGLWEAAMEESQ